MLGSELAKVVGLIGKKVVWHINGMDTKVMVKDVRIEWGRVRYLVESDLGTTKWVDQDSIREISMAVVHSVVDFARHLF